MTYRPLKKPSGRSIFHAEDLDSTVNQLLAWADEIAEDHRLPDSEIDVDAAPDFTEIAFEKLRSVLEDEIVPAVETPNGDIRDEEIRREIIKKALVGIKMPLLRDVARGIGVRETGVSEDLATRIAAYYNWNEEEIAKLILESEEEDTRTEKGHQARIFALQEAPEIAQTRRLLSFVRNRYIRTGIARWFVFGEPVVDDGRIEVPGDFHSYQAGVSTAASGEASLTSQPSSTGSRIEVASRRTFVVHDAAATAARASSEALRLALGNPPLSFVPYADTRAGARKGDLHTASEFMLDLLYTRLIGPQYGAPNLYIARFNVADEVEPDASSGARPSLRAVRFEGEHLLDSVVACRLLTTESRPLADMSFTTTVRADESGAIRGTFPIRVSIERDHVLVATGLGTGEHELSASVHQHAVEAVRREIEFGVADLDRLDGLSTRIKRRAEMAGSPEKADMLIDPPA